MVKRLAAVALLLASCASTGPLDRSQVPWSSATPTKVSVKCVPVNGATAKVTTTGDTSITGELLAASHDEVVVLRDHEWVLRLDASQIARVDVTIYPTAVDAGLLAAWGIVGTASALTHGYFFLYTGPSWGVLTLAAAAPVGADGEGKATVDSDFESLAHYARFPQGMPPGFARDRVQRAPGCDE